MRLETIALDRLVDPRAPVRAEIDVQAIHELAVSIKEVGLIEPIVVRPDGETFEVVVGHRRLMACRMLELADVACLVDESGDAEGLTAKRLHENLIRVDMTPVEEALVYAEAFEKYQDLEKVAAMAHRSLQVVERRLALLSGDAGVRAALQQGTISAGVAEELNKVQDKPTRDFLLRFAVQEGATVSKVRGWRQGYAQNPVQTGFEPPQPQTEGEMAAIADRVLYCWLCGSTEEPHDLRVRMMHQSCERLYRRQLEERERRVTERVGS